MFQNFKLFGSIAKTEEQADGTIKVFGVASSGARDQAGEVVKPDAMKAALPDYSRFPALREMHEPKAAGRVLEASVDEDGFTNIVAHVVDPVAVQKVKSQVYPAFSIGGKVLERDPDDKSVISALRLVEISLVDSPCNPDAALTMWKADMTDQEFKPAAADVVARAKDLAKAAGHQRFKDHLFEASQELICEHELAKGEVVEPDDPAVAIDGTGAPAGEDVIAVADDKEAAADVSEEAGVDATPDDADAGASDEAQEASKEASAGAEQISDPASALATALADALEKAKGGIDYADPGYQEDGKKRYPLDTEEHIRSAWGFINHQKNADKYTADQLDKIKAKIIAAWKDKIDADGPPSAEKMAPLADLSKTATALRAIKSESPLLEKSLYTVGWLAQALDQIVTIQSCSEFEEDCEGDDSKVPTMLADACRQLGETLVAMAQEEVAEALQAIAGDSDTLSIEYVGDDEPVLLARQIVDLTKADEALMEKAGARNSKADQERLQAAHDNVAKLGAVCDPANCPDGADKAAAIEADNERLAKALAAAAPQVAELGETITTLKSELADLRKRFEDEPLPAKTAGPVILRAVGKGEDSTGAAAPQASFTKAEFEKMLAELPDEQRALAMIKFARLFPQAIGPKAA